MTLVQELSNLLGARRTIREFKDVEYALEDLHRIIETLLTRHAIGINELDTDLTTVETILGDVTAAELDALHDLGNSTLVQTDGSGNLADLSSPTLAEIAYVGEVTSSIQTQLDAKLAAAALGVPRWHVNRGGTNQTSVGTSATKMRWTIEVYDSDSIFSHDADDSGGTTESRATPDKAGYYVNAVSLSFGVVSDGNQIGPLLYKNGSPVFDLKINAGGSARNRIGQVFPPVYMNGTTDYFEMYGSNATSTDSVSGNIDETWWAGWWIGP
jgi:hypothetical protein